MEVFISALFPFLDLSNTFRLVLLLGPFDSSVQCIPVIAIRCLLMA